MLLTIKKTTCVSLGAFVLALIPSVIYAGGFQLFAEGAQSVGLVDAGDASSVDDASDEFYNPASMTYFDNIEVSSGGVYVPLSTQFNKGGTITEAGVPPTTTTTTTDVLGGTYNVVPNFHLVVPVSNQFSFGFGVTSPFGLATDYAADSQVAAYATDTDVRSININPSVAYAISSKWSVGAGLDVLYGSANYDSTDLSNSLSSWGCGYNLGIMYQLSSSTRLGLSYRSAIDVTANGDSTLANGNTNQASIYLPLPAYTMFSVNQEMNDKFTLLFSAFYTQWDTLDTLTVDNSALLDDDLVVPQNFSNTWFLSMGAKYKLTPKVTLNAGVGYDQTPTQDGNRDIRLPDADRTMVGTGVHIDMSKKMAVDIAYQHIFMPDADISATVYSGGPAGIELFTINGTSSSYANLLGLQMSYKFNA
jgi:long-chain fatty acid transport protein